jgi:16S rRNA (guanine(966)-N(2))-methyltransferase RsmD
MDRVKESLFNILGEVTATRWLDLFAGKGQVGIEALSRGATEVVFVDRARAAAQTVRDNLTHTGLEQGATVLQTDALQYLSMPAGKPFDIIYIAPPQYLGIWIDALTAVDAAADQLLAGDGQVIIQIDPREFRELSLSSLALSDRRRYGNTLLAFYQRNAMLDGES